MFNPGDKVRLINKGKNHCYGTNDKMLEIHKTNQILAVKRQEDKYVYLNELGNWIVKCDELVPYGKTLIFILED